jgi:putative tryptophan/tyrosine transport system substrate-binding protein
MFEDVTMKRRTIGLLVTLALSLFVVPLAAGATLAQKMYRVGLVSIAGDPKWWQPFLEAMGELGYVEGRNLTVKRAFARGRAEDLPRLVNELVRSEVDVAVTTGTRETVAVKQVAPTLPIVMLLVPDPVGQGFVKTLAQPGGNVTGLTNLVPGLVLKYVELLQEAVPSASRFGVVATPPNPLPEQRMDLEAAAKTLWIVLSFIAVHGPDDFDALLAGAKRDGVGAIIATADPVTFLHRQRLVQAALQNRLPGIYWAREYVEEGELLTYSANIDELRRRAATYVDKILKGAKPADLPVEQPMKFELVINLRTAQALGLTIPPTLLFQADEGSTEPRLPIRLCSPMQLYVPL